MIQKDMPNFFVEALYSERDMTIGIGSGGTAAQAAAVALMRHTDLDARRIAEEALRIAAGICVYTNDVITVEEI